MGTSGCPSCGTRATARVGGGLCPACLLGLALLEPGEGAEDPGSGDDLSSAAVLAVLDGGADHTVYLAERPGTRQLLAIEVVRAAAAVPTTAGIFTARVKELRRLSHPGIAAVAGGWVTAEGDYCVASEYVPGAPLERYCSARHLEPSERMSLFLAACRAIEYAHAAGVLHGRLGAGSIVVTRRSGQMQPVTTGFGLLAGTRAAPALDVAALGGILERLVGEESVPAAALAAHAARSGEIATVAALIAALKDA
jgi:hypothetical protein